MAGQNHQNSAVRSLMSSHFNFQPAIFNFPSPRHQPSTNIPQLRRVAGSVMVLDIFIL